MDESVSDWKDACMANISKGIEDFEEFERKIDEVSRILQNSISIKEKRGLKSNDVLEESKKKGKSELQPSSVVLHSKRSVFNTNISSPNTNLHHFNTNTMSQEEFMRAVEKDAEERHRVCTEKKIESDRLNQEGNTFFRQGRLEKALCFYNKALEIRRDSFQMYSNRALVNLRLGLFRKVIADCDSSLKLKDTLKARLFKARALYETGEKESSVLCIDEVKQKFPNKIQEITDYVNEWSREAVREGRDC